MAKLPVSKNLRFLPQEKAEPVANWKNAQEYSYRILDRARAASTESFNQLMTNPVSGQITRNEAEALLWRWEFLRRLPDTSVITSHSQLIEVRGVSKTFV